MSKLYIFEIASAIIGVLLIVADCRHMMTDAPDAPQWAAMHRTPDMEYLSSAQGARMQQANVIKQLDVLSLLAFAGAARSKATAQ